MSESTFDVPSAAQLTSRYTRWLIWYLIPFLALWLLGIESLYSHPTPFYAQFHLNFGNRIAGTTLLAVLLLTYGPVRKLANPGYAPSSRWPGRIRAAIAAFLLACAAILCFLPGSTPVERALSAWATLRWQFLAIAVFIAGFGLLFRFLRQRNWPTKPLDVKTTRLLLVGLVAFAALFAIAIAMTRGGFNGVSQAYERQSYEYIGDVGKGMSIHGLFAKYTELHPFLSMHAKVHPPGPIAVLWLLSYVAGREPFGLSIATIIFGALAIIPLFYWLRDIAGETVAVAGSAIYLLVPSVVLFTATSADILFMPFTMTTLFLFWRAIHRSSIAYAVGAGVAYALCSILSFSLLSLGAFFAFVGLWRLASAEYRGAVFKTAAVMLLAFLATHGLVWLWSGFNVYECFLQSKAQFDTDQYELDKSSPRYAAWTFRLLNPLCWLYFVGLPVAALFVTRCLRARGSDRAWLVILVLTLLVLNLLYLARGEGERSAMYIVPFVIAGAALELGHYVRASASLAPLSATCAFLAFQCWFTETFFYTYW